MHALVIESNESTFAENLNLQAVAKLHASLDDN